MTKEELKQEAEEKCVCTNEAMRIMYGIGYIDGAEPREKRIAELEDKLANADYQLEGRDLEIKELEARIEGKENEFQYFSNSYKIKITNLEAQIEKMKCCENCRYCNKWGEANSNSPNCKKCNWLSNWKIRR